MPRNLILVNPASNHGQALRNLEKAVEKSSREIRHLYHRATLHVLQGEERVGDPAILDLIRRHKRVFLCGGDGTINHLVTAILDHHLADKVKIGLLPGGFGNAAAAMLGITDMAQALTLLRKGCDVRKTDVLRTNIPACPYVVFTAGVGLEGKIVHTRQRFKWLPLLGYVLAAVVEFFGHRRDRFTVKIDGGTRLSVLASSIMIANGPYFGMVTSAPKAKPHDGLMDLRLFHENLNFFLNLQPWNSQLYPVDDFSYMDIRARRVEIKGRLVVQVDGDPQEAPSPLKVDVLPRAVRYLVPS